MLLCVLITFWFLIKSFTLDQAKLLGKMGQGSEEVVFWHNRMSWGRYHVRARLSLLKSMLTKQILVHNQCFIYQFATA